MATRSGEAGISRRSWLLAGFTVPRFSAVAADSLKVIYDGDTLRVAAPTLHFLTGKPWERLKYGDVVAYVLQLELLNESRTAVVRPQKGRFVVSYALWEEKFSVTQLGSSPGLAPRTVEGLSATAAETWCFDNLTMSTLGLEPNLYYWLRLALRTGTARDFADESKIGISIHDLIDFLGRKHTEVTKYGPLDRASWPDSVRVFSGGLEGERVVRAGQEGNRLEYLVRHGNEIWSYSENLGDVAMDRLTREIRDARRAVEDANARDLRRGIKRTYVLLAAGIWLVSLALLVYLAHRISRPIQELTTGLGKLAAGALAHAAPERPGSRLPPRYPPPGATHQ